MAYYLAPFEREQRLRKHRRWCTGICGNSLLQAAEAGLQLVGTEVSEERKGTQAQPLEHVMPQVAMASGCACTAVTSQVSGRGRIRRPVTVWTMSARAAGSTVKTERLI